MQAHKVLILVTITFFTLTTSALGVGYVKLGDIKGEATGDQSTPGQNVDSGTPPQPTGLLLPAVQSSRATAPTDEETAAESDSKGKKKGNVEANWKVEKGSK